MKIAKYKSLPHNYISIIEYKGENNWPETSEALVRVSEPVEVEFIPLPRSEIVLKEVAQVDKDIQELFDKIEVLRGKKAELLCLTYEGEDNV